MVMLCVHVALTGENVVNVAEEAMLFLRTRTQRSNTRDHGSYAFYIFPFLKLMNLSSLAGTGWLRTLASQCTLHMYVCSPLFFPTFRL